jgi:hypothetical protein
MPAFTGAVVSSERETLREIFHRAADVLRDFERVRARRLKRGDDSRRFAVERSVLLIVLRTELDASDVVQPHVRAVRILAQNDVAKLFGFDEPPWRPNRVRQLLAQRRRLTAELTGGIHGVLSAHGRLHVGRGQSEPGQHVRLQPDPHRVVAGAEVADISDPLHAQERVVDVDQRVVREESRIVAPVRRIQRHDHQRERERLLDRDAERAHVGG